MVSYLCFVGLVVISAAVAQDPPATPPAPGPPAPPPAATECFEGPLYKDHECQTKHTYLGLFDAVNECAEAAAQDDSCDYIMWSERYKNWGCTCCADGGAAGVSPNPYYAVYAVPLCPPVPVIAEHACGELGQDLGIDFDSVNACGAAAAREGCNFIQWSVDFHESPGWSCRCCGTNSEAGGVNNVHWGVYSLPFDAPNPLYHDRECGTQGQDLGADFNSVQECAEEAALQDCSHIMWSEGYSRASGDRPGWGCQCCARGSGTRDNLYWAVYNVPLADQTYGSTREPTPRPIPAPTPAPIPAPTPWSTPAPTPVQCAVELHAIRECKTRGPKLSGSEAFTSAHECGEAAAQEDSCDHFMWSEQYNSHWGCTCCADGGETGGPANTYYGVYAVTCDKSTPTPMTLTPTPGPIYVNWHGDGECGTPGTNLGKAFASVQECGEAAAQRDPSCKRIQWSEDYNYLWGCSCCVPEGGTDGDGNIYYKVYEITDSETAGMELMHEGYYCNIAHLQTVTPTSGQTLEGCKASCAAVDDCKFISYSISDPTGGYCYGYSSCDASVQKVNGGYNIYQKVGPDGGGSSSNNSKKGSTTVIIVCCVVAAVVLFLLAYLVRTRRVAAKQHHRASMPDAAKDPHEAVAEAESA